MLNGPRCGIPLPRSGVEGGRKKQRREEVEEWQSNVLTVKGKTSE